MVSAAARSTSAAALVFVASVLLIAPDAPAWCVVIALGAATWRVLVALGYIAPLRKFAGMRFLLGAVTAALVIAVAANFRTLNGLGAGTALLLVMGALKLLESRSRRDDGIVIGVALFMLLASALAAQSLVRVPFYLLTVWGACAAIAMVADHGGALAPRAALRLSARALAMSLPLAAACFLFFPRVAGQFWALQRGEQATTGLSDEMSPGGISELATDYDPAFRVRFDGTPPPRSALYWRGPVLNDFDGFTWRRNRAKYYPGAHLEMQGAPVRYHITLEPTQQRWLFALDTVDAVSRRDVLIAPQDRQLSVIDPITSTVSYDAVSYRSTRNQGPLSILGRRHETTLPLDRNPRARALALELRARAGSDTEFARAVLDWFRDNGLEYTLEPGVTTVDSVDTTLFDSKRGFCGHFASSYATMMRAAGIPARVVTGYLGGEWNPVGGYLIVRQSDAHAWTEIWLDDTGWTRVDPTAVVAPERLQRGIFDMLSDSLPAASAFMHSSVWLNRLEHLWDGANQWWQERVVEFNMRAQLDLLRRLGIDSPSWQQLGWAFTSGLVAWIAWVSLTLRRGVARIKPDRIGRAWIRATRKLARVAPARAPAEGPMEYARRIGVHRPDLAARIHQLASLYARLRFGREASHQDIALFEREVRNLAC
jgi:transglutaminase-like putative cysteine protease